MNDKMLEIEARAKTFAGARDELAERLATLRDEIDQAKKRRLQGLKNALQRFQAAHAELLEEVDANRQLFDRPKSRVMHGVKLGFRKQSGRVEWDDVDAVVELIRKKLPDRAEELLVATYRPVKDRLSELTGDELRRIGVTITADGEQAFASAIDDDVTKLLKALISDAELEEIAP